jgi:hypothetical protein
MKKSTSSLRCFSYITAMERYAHNLTFKEVIDLIGPNWKKYLYHSGKEKAVTNSPVLVANATQQ